MNLDQSFFTEGSDDIDSRSLNIDSFVVSASTNALGGDDTIQIFSSQEQQPVLLINRGATLDGGIGSNTISISSIITDNFTETITESGDVIVQNNPTFEPPALIGLQISGTIKRFANIFSSAINGIINNGTIDLGNGSSASTGAASLLPNVQIQASGFAYGLRNAGKITLPSSQNSNVNLRGAAVGKGLWNSGTISTNLGKDSVTGVSFRSFGIDNQRTISLGSNDDIIFATSIINNGTIGLGSGVDKLRLYTGGGYNITNIIRGKGRIDLGTGNDQFTFGGAATGVDSLPLNSPPGKVSGGSGIDTIVITSDQFRFTRLSGSTYRIFDANNAAIADVDGFELVQSSLNSQPVAIRDGFF
jgi:hypothetical protein